MDLTVEVGGDGADDFDGDLGIAVKFVVGIRTKTRVGGAKSTPMDGGIHLTEGL